MRRMLAGLLPLLAVALFAASACGEQDAPDGAVHILKTNSEVGPIMVRYIDRGISRAEDNNGKLVVIELDTPGGSTDSMRDIIRRIEKSKVPVAVYVTPPGGRAASAGTFITMAGQIAAMAPDTNIGAAAAINSDGSDIGGTLGKKIENDNVALIRGLAETNGRNADWAEQAVREAVAAGATDAVNLHVVDFLATSEQDFLRQAEGRTVKVAGQPVTITGVVDAPIVRTNYTFWDHFLEFLANPTVASLLISIGFLGLVLELANPGLILPGVAGAIAIVLGFLGFGVLPVNEVGLVLMFLALILFVLELHIPSGGVLGIGGTIALVLGAIIAFHDTPAEFRPPTWLLIALGVLIVGMFLSISVTLSRMTKWSAETGTRGLVGKIAVARTQLAPAGYVFIQGERWKARSDFGVINEGERVRITEADGFTLRVRREEPPNDPATA